MRKRKEIRDRKMIKSRIKYFFLICILLFSCLIGRIYNITVYKGKEYKKRIDNQSLEKINLTSNRGIIYDRNNIPLTDTKEKQVLIFPKNIITSNDNVLSLIKDATNLKDENIYKAIQEQISNQIIEVEVKKVNYNKIKKLEKYSVLVTNKSLRYSNNNILAHLIGYTNKSENEGISGIEKYMNEELKYGNENYISVFKPGANNNNFNYLKGSIDEVENKENSKHLKLTIDSRIQKVVEKIMDKEKNPSAVVISDIKTGEILSICSRPNFDANKIATYIDSKDGELQNRALGVTYPPGSVFKLVVLYSALKNNIINEDFKYDCHGSVKINSSNDVLNCNNKKAHGLQNLSLAFANSCNGAFYKIGQKVGEEKIIEAIRELHLDEKVDIGIDEEKNSKLPQNIAMNNLAIGQGNMEFTPLQINQLTQIIANNGTYKPLYIYDSMINNNRNTIKSYKTNKKSEVISPYVMLQIKNMMIKVSKEGTAKSLADLYSGCGVKTGTAESSLDGIKISHGWITGFYPEENPKYGITILVEGTKNNSKSATPIFKEICENLK